MLDDAKRKECAPERIRTKVKVFRRSGPESQIFRTDLARGLRSMRGRGARGSGHGMHVLDCPGHVKDRRRRVTLFTEYAVAIPMRVVVTHMVFAGKGMFEVARAFVNRSAFRPTTLSIVHTGSHFSLAFDYGTKSNTNFEWVYTEVTHILLPH